ncbi:secreted protein [Rhodopirellula sp. SWK7]|nr:secreted protein [Rhodopirellula sp. SWK7]
MPVPRRPLLGALAGRIGSLMMAAWGFAPRIWVMPETEYRS